MKASIIITLFCITIPCILNASEASNSNLQNPLAPLHTLLKEAKTEEADHKKSCEIKDLTLCALCFATTKNLTQCKHNLYQLRLALTTFLYESTQQEETPENRATASAQLLLYMSLETPTADIVYKELKILDQKKVFLETLELPDDTAARTPPISPRQPKKCLAS